MNRGDIKLYIDRCVAHDVPDCADMIEKLADQLAAREKQIVMLREALDRFALIDLRCETLPETFAFDVLGARKALAPTADLSKSKEG